MDKKAKAGSEIAAIAAKIVALLDPLSSEDRHKAVSGSLTLLGESSTGRIPAVATPGSPSQPAADSGKHDQNMGGLPAKGASWAKQNGLSMAQIERVFDITSLGASVIAGQVPGKGKSEQTRNAYVLQGLSCLLASGDPTFTDKDARKTCEELGCYDPTNHAKHMSAKGNLLSGTKGSAWKLTAPGLKHGADLVKQLTKEE
jgi:hypothetical protein